MSMSVSIITQVCSAYPAKRLARAARVHTTTAARWRHGETTPSASALLEMMRADDDVFLGVLRAIGRADHAARAQATLHLINALAALEGRA